MTITTLMRRNTNDYLNNGDAHDIREPQDSSDTHGWDDSQDPAAGRPK